MLGTCEINEAGYDKNKPILKNISFSIKHGELVGLIGPNGAGKSSTIKSILGVIKYFDGNINMPDYAYIPERPIFYEALTLWEHLYFLHSTLNVEKDKFMAQAANLLKRFHLEQAADQYLDSYSKGMQQKAMIMFAFLQEPSLYIIDEPFTGLDPKTTKQLLALIEQEKQRGASILMSTHILDTAEKICDRFLLISRGHLIAEGSLASIQEQSGLKDGSLFDCFDILTERDLNDR